MLGGKHQLNVKGSLKILHAFKIHIGLSILMRSELQWLSQISRNS